MTAAGTQGLLDAIGTARRHVDSEVTNDVDHIMSTVSQTVCYLMPDVTSPEAPLAMLTDRQGVHGFYSHERTFLEVVSGVDLVECVSDWYMFHEVLSTTRQVETGTLHRNEVAVLFPVADDGIIGEILIARRKWTDVYAGTPGPLPASAPDGDVAGWRSQAIEAHDRFLDGLRNGRAAEAAAAFNDTATIAVLDIAQPPVQLVAGSGRDVTLQRSAMLVDAVEDPEVTVLQRFAAEWYVFSEWVVRGTARAGRIHGVEAGQRVDIRSAGIFAVGDDRLLGGEQGYSVIRPAT
jgi:hypothetical protein